MIRAYPIIAACLLGLILLAGCGATPKERVVTQTVYVSVPVHCKPDIQTTVVYPDTDDSLRTAADIFERTKLVMAGRALRMARIAELEAALKGCE